MSTASLVPVNLQAGLSTNPLSSAVGAWASLSQVKYVAFFNTTSTIIAINGSNGSKTIWPLTADIVETEGQGITVSPQFAPTTPIGTYLGACPVTLYDNAEDMPEGFPLPLPAFPTGGSALVGWEINYLGSPLDFQPPAETTALVIVNNSVGTVAHFTVTGVETAQVYASTLLINPGQSASIPVGAGDTIYSVVIDQTIPFTVYANQIPATNVQVFLSANGVINVPYGTAALFVQLEGGAFTRPIAPTVTDSNACPLPTIMVNNYIGNNPAWIVPLNGNSSGPFQISWVSTQTFRVTTLPSNPFINLQDTGFNPTIANPGAGVDWQYILPIPAKLRAINAVLTNNSGGTCNPIYRIQYPNGFWDVVPAGTAGLATGFAYAVEAALGAQALPLTNTRVIQPLPDFGILPIGTTIFGLANPNGANVAWSSIYTLFTPQ